MKLRKSTINDLRPIMEIIAGAQESLKSQGIDQWQNQYPNEETILNDIKNEESYVYIDENKDKIIATVAVSFQGEETYEKIYEGAWISNSPYAVIHRIAVHKDYYGNGIGMQLLLTIQDLCEKRDIHSLRIDTHKDNISMQKLLDKFSFIKCGIIHLRDGNERLAYEKRIGENEKTVLVTGFDPFGGETTNPAYEAVKRLPGYIKHAKVVTLEIPTSFNQSFKVLQERIYKIKPDIVLCVGQAAGRSLITIEKVAINYEDARITDNDQRQPCDTAIKEGGETAYFTNLPIRTMVERIKEQGIPAGVSYSAGTFVCNSIFYKLMDCINTEFPNMKGGFIHVPYATSQVLDKPAGTPSMSIENIETALKLAIEAAL